jgi:hypothetical protein
MGFSHTLTPVRGPGTEHLSLLKVTVYRTLDCTPHTSSSLRGTCGRIACPLSPECLYYSVERRAY